MTVFTKNSILYIKLSSKYASDKLSFTSYSKVNAFLRITIFRLFSQRNPYTVKTLHCISGNDIIKYYHWYSQKSFQRITERLRIAKSRKIKSVPTVFNFHEWQYNTEFLQVLVVHRRFCQHQTNSLVMAYLYILQTKNKCTYHAPYLA